MDRMVGRILKQGECRCGTRVLYSCFSWKSFGEKWCDRVSIILTFKIINVAMMNIVTNTTVMNIGAIARFL
ncbi:hypothetical protein A0J57_21020 [Sphingobium sp. 22B]|nr:hypothetical protein A0J57_21020 [Sphingobium sp. 22B]OAP29906.1 hypothetical protein A8O16_20995 [Sphingobium sp. 20006FA]